MKRQIKISEVIEDSGIHQAIDLLKEKLNNYKQLQHVKGNCYLIQHEVNCVCNEIESLENQLCWMIATSRKWETLE